MARDTGGSAGDELWFYDGTDEHGGQDRAGRGQGRRGTPQAMAGSELSRVPLDLASARNPVQTTNPDDRAATSGRPGDLQKLWDAGEIYLGNTAATIATAASVIHEKEIVDGKCPNT